ncbi:hypothetical protein BV20DRAFT_1051695 [Pilatotrama ljubarskyi]|nr:hypothetical protein BV20DRAFT_1051695 [Pilatotrama ljubarskyi]
MNRSHSYKRRHHSKSGAERPLPSVWDSSEAWAACAKALREYDEDMIQDWKEEIDTLLVFAGLFSAILTAFNIESYKLLQQQPEDATVAILSQISAQLNSFSVNANFANTTSPTGPGTLLPPFKANGLAVRLNAWWFSALVCSLLVASLGLLVKQWLRQYLAGSSSISRERTRIRQYRYDGLRKWRVPEIILCLPILLQVALVLFFAGLLDLLWSLHPAVAGVVTAIVSVAMLFAALTTLAPPLYADCPYKSPQSWVLCILLQSTKRAVVALASRFYGRLHSPGDVHELLASKLDLSVVARNKLTRAFRTWLQQVALSRPFSNWQERERTLANGAAATLDDATLATADATFMDDAFLQGVVRSCMSDIESHAALRCLDRILLQRAPRVIYGLPYWELGLEGGDKGTIALMHLLLDVLHRLNQESEGDQADEPRRHLLTTMHRLVRALPGETSFPPSDQATRVLLRRTFDVLAGVVDPGPTRPAATTFVRERAFHIMLKLFPRFQCVGPTCIAAFCSYSKRMRDDNSPYRFVQACCMVIRASATLAHGTGSRSSTIAQPDVEPTLKPTGYIADPRPIASRTSTITLHAEPSDTSVPAAGPDAGTSKEEYASVRPAVVSMLLDLEDFFSIPVARAVECRATMAMLAECAEAVVALSGRDRHAISASLVDVLTDMVSDAWDAQAETRDPSDSGQDGEGDNDQHDALNARQAVRLLRRTYGLPWHDTEQRRR